MHYPGPGGLFRKPLVPGPLVHRQISSPQSSSQPLHPPPPPPVALDTASQNRLSPINDQTWIARDESSADLFGASEIYYSVGECRVRLLLLIAPMQNSSPDRPFDRGLGSEKSEEYSRERKNNKQECSRNGQLWQGILIWPLHSMFQSGWEKNERKRMDEKSKWWTIPFYSSREKKMIWHVGLKTWADKIAWENYANRMSLSNFHFRSLTCSRCVFLCITDKLVTTRFHIKSWQSFAPRTHRLVELGTFWSFVQ